MEYSGFSQARDQEQRNLIARNNNRKKLLMRDISTEERGKTIVS